MWEVKYASDEHDYESVNEMKKKKKLQRTLPPKTHTHTYNNAEEKEGWHETSDWGVEGWHNMQVKKKKRLQNFTQQVTTLGICTNKTVVAVKTWPLCRQSLTVWLDERKWYL